MLLLIINPIKLLAIELTDFRDPDRIFDEAFFNGRFNLNSGNQDQTSFDGTTSGFYQMNYSTLPFVWKIRFEGSLDINRDSAANAETEESYLFNVKSNFDKYLTDNLFGLFGFGGIDLAFRRQIGDDEADNPYSKLTTGIGYGRVIDATPLADVLRVVESLKEYGVIVGKVDDSTYLELAAIVGKRREFQSRYGFEDYEQYWIEALEKVMQKAGILKNNALGAVGVIKTRYVLVLERISPRKHGWSVRGGVGYITSTFEDADDDDPSLDLGFEYAKPFGYQLQFTEEASYSRILADNQFDLFDNRMGLTYELSDRIDWENIWTINAVFPSRVGTNDLMTNKLSSIFRYYVTNLVTADLTFSLTKYDDGIDDNGNDDIDKVAFFGFTYRLK
ncbi:DUF481 domain-containing protein [Candidatus Marithrix sp. Canyon 246]|nr:DUF481 domain-containing protein [Candidatus Marithrix sp. Canyon 246]